MTKPKELTEKEFNKLIHKLSKPTFNYILKRINKEVLENEEFKSLEANQFYNLLVASLASVNTNLLRWVQAFHKIKTNDEINFTALRKALHHHIDEQLKVIVQ